MARPVAAAASIDINASPERTRAASLALDPVRIVRAQGLLPGVRAVSGQRDAWSAEGQMRVLTLTDGATAEETLLALEPGGYRYRIAGFTGPFARLASHAEARFEAAPRGEGTRLSWTYEFHPKGAVSAAILSFLVDGWWNAFMEAALTRLKDEIERA